MLSKGKITLIRSLKLRKYREKYNKVVVEGTKVVNEVLRETPAAVDILCVTPRWIEANSIPEEVPERNRFVVAEPVFKQISSFKTPSPVLAVIRPESVDPDPEEALKSVCLYLDGIRDPGNLGTILRIADWFGYHDVFLSEDCVDVYNPKVIQASMGSVFRIRWGRCPLSTWNDMEGLNTILTLLEGIPVQKFTFPGNGLLILGNESEGVRSQKIPGRKLEITIPAALNTRADSLNVAVAAGILCAYARLGG